MSSIPSAADTALINKLSMPTCRLQQMPVRVWDWWASKAEGGGAMMSMCPHVIDALRWVPSLQHRITRPGIVCSHDTATNVACCVQLPCIAVQHCAVRALQVVKMRKSMLYCCSVSGSLLSSCGCAQCTAPCMQHSHGSQKFFMTIWTYGPLSAAAQLYAH